MGKGTQNTNSSAQEEPLHTYNEREQQYKRSDAGKNLNVLESTTEKSGWKGSRSSRVFIPVCVVLGLLSFALLVALTAGRMGSHLPHPEFSHVCPDAWLGFQGKCYYFSEVESNWTTSQESCEALGASLALISNMDELTFIKRYKGEANHWFGLRKGNDDSWRWTDGTVFNNWFEVRGGGQCAYLNQERISSSLCHTKKNWLCSRPDDYILWKQKAYPREKRP